MSGPHAFAGTVADIPLLIKSASSQSERRVNPTWTIAHFRTRLEPITGIPASAQTLTIRIGSQDAVPITAANEEQQQLSGFGLQPYAEIFVSRQLFLFSYWGWTSQQVPASRANECLPHVLPRRITGSSSYTTSTYSIGLSSHSFSSWPRLSQVTSNLRPFRRLRASLARPPSFESAIGYIYVISTVKDGTWCVILQAISPPL